MNENQRINEMIARIEKGTVNRVILLELLHDLDAPDDLPFNHKDVKNFLKEKLMVIH